MMIRISHSILALSLACSGCAGGQGLLITPVPGVSCPPCAQVTTSAAVAPAQALPAATPADPIPLMPPVGVPRLDPGGTVSDRWLRVYYRP